MGKKEIVNKRRDKAVQKRRYDKVIVVGHKRSGAPSVFEWMCRLGMRKAKGKPRKITEKILKHYRLPKKEYKSLYVEKVWDGLALDIFVKNADRRWWGWYDEKAVSVLEYWKRLDGKLAFVLVYTSPEAFLYNYFQTHPFSEKKLREMLRVWTAYHGRMLHFYHRNKKRTLLLHADAFENDRHEVLKQLRRHIGTVHTLENNEVMQKTDTEHEIRRRALVGTFGEYVRRQPRAAEMYEELQSVATLPYVSSVEINDLAVDLLHALYGWRNEARVLRQEKEKLAETFQKENAVLLDEMMRLQEELEIHFNEKRRLEAGAAELSRMEEEERRHREELLAQIDALQKRVEEKEAALQKRLDEKDNRLRRKEEEKETLLNQLFQVQEELEKYYLENEALKRKIEASKRRYGAAERIKSQLSYRLGSHMIERSRSVGGLLLLPFTLLGVVRRFRKEQALKKGQKLPPIHTYADAYEAEKVKKHLSYMLGQTMIQTVKGNPFGIFVLPFRLRKTYKQFKEQRDR